MQADKIRLKVCGMRDAHNIAEIAALRPDYMGFIFYKGSARFVGEDFIVPGGISSDIKRVGVFVNESTDKMLQIAKDSSLDYVQLHGQESPEQCKVLSKSGVGVIKVFNVDDRFDFANTSEYADASDFFLFDARGPQPGGNGTPFNWRGLSAYDQQVPFFLSGGISAANIDDIGALRDMNLYAVDVNSGVEHSPALKDKELVTSLMNKLKAYEV